METLVLEPLKGKKLRVLLVTKEYDEPWKPNKSDKSTSSSLSFLINKPTIVFCDFLRTLVLKYHPDFATEERGMRTEKEFYEENLIAKTFKALELPLYPVEISDYAKVYLDAILDDKRDFLRGLLAEVEKLAKDVNDKSKDKFDYLMAYCQYLQDEINEEEKKIEFSIRERWIVKGILDQAKKINKDQILCLHICSPKHVKGTIKLLRSLGVEEILPVELRKKVSLNIAEGEAKVKSLEEILRTLEIRAIPVLRETSIKNEPPHILYFLDSDEHVSPFDINMAYDAGFDVVIPYSKVTPDQAKRLVQDAIFSRSPKGRRRTKFFIGGTDLRVTREILNAISEVMFPPFEAAVIVDPRGAYSTAAAMVAKVEEALKKLELGEIKGKSVVILAGTGPVGRTVATICARLGCDVYITSRRLEKARSVANELAEEEGVVVKAVQASNPDEIYEIAKDKEVILTTGRAGVRLIPKEVLDKLKGVKVMADVNAVEPTGIAQLKPTYDMKEIAPGIFGIGALPIGDLKYRLEKKILEDAKTASKGIFDYRYAFENVKSLLVEHKLPELRIHYSEQRR